MSTPIIWSNRVQAYLTLRRNFGFELATEESLLKSFGQFADDRHAEFLDLNLATGWAQNSRNTEHHTWGRRIEVLRGFAKFMLRIDARTVVLPSNLFGPTHRRRVPHIFTEEELLVLLEATDTLKPSDRLRAANCRTIFELLAKAGLRISEAVNLTQDEVDLQSGILDIRDAKRHHCRIVPLHETAIPHLQAYAQFRDRFVSGTPCNRFFIQQDGRSVSARSMLYALQSLCKQLGWTVRGDYAHHRLHDLRHTFIVRSLLRLYEQGMDIERGLPIISTYVGHAKLADTYWYLTGIPELMSIASRRFRHYAQEAL